MTSAKFLRLLRDFVLEYHHAKFGSNWTTIKEKQRGALYSPPAYMVPKDTSLNRVNPTLPGRFWYLVHVSNLGEWQGGGLHMSHPPYHHLDFQGKVLNFCHSALLKIRFKISVTPSLPPLDKGQSQNYGASINYNGLLTLSGLLTL